MKVSVFDVMFQREYLPNRVPVICELAVERDLAPFLVTDTKGDFVSPLLLDSRQAEVSEGTMVSTVVRCAFTQCAVSSEASILCNFYAKLKELAGVTPDLEAAFKYIRLNGYTPSFYVMSSMDICTRFDKNVETLDKLMLCQGYVAKVEGVPVLASDLPPGSSFLVGGPDSKGIYFRVQEFVSLVVYKVDKAFCVVDFP